jgi:hypothetical protein
MPHLDKSGPESKGSKTGRKLGFCLKIESDSVYDEKLGIGEAKRRHSGGGIGKGKRLKYNI